MRPVRKRNLKQIHNIQEKLRVVPNIPQRKECWGIEYSSKCTCGGTMVAIREKSNGHLRVYCEKCGFQIIE